MGVGGGVTLDEKEKGRYFLKYLKNPILYFWSCNPVFFFFETVQIEAPELPLLASVIERWLDFIIAAELMIRVCFSLDSSRRAVGDTELVQSELRRSLLISLLLSFCSVSLSLFFSSSVVFIF